MLGTGTTWGGTLEMGLAKPWDVALQGGGV